MKKEDKEKYLEKIGKPHRKLMNFAAKNEVTPMSQTKNDSKRETFFANY